MSCVWKHKLTYGKRVLSVEMYVLAKKQKTKLCKLTEKQAVLVFLGKLSTMLQFISNQCAHGVSENPSQNFFNGKKLLKNVTLRLWILSQ